MLGIFCVDVMLVQTTCIYSIYNHQGVVIALSENEYKRSTKIFVFPLAYARCKCAQIPNAYLT